MSPTLSILEIEKIQNQHHEDADHDEALSLCDLPITDVTRPSEEDEDDGKENKKGGDDFNFDFEFGSLIGSITSLDGEMCVADEVFSGGQMLPFRHSVSPEAGLVGFRTLSRSESMDHIGFGSRSNSSSSRSSSVTSHYSTTSNISNSCNTTCGAKTIPLVPKAGVRSQFHSYPSPKPQAWGSGTLHITHVGLSPPTSKKSTTWDVLRLGLVRAPEIGPQGLKLRHRTSNFGKTSTIMPSNTKSTNNVENSPVVGSKIRDLLLEAQKGKNHALSRNGVFKSCKCSTGAIEPMPTRSVCGHKSGSFKSKIAVGENKFSAINQVLNEDDDLARKKLLVQEEERNKKIRQGKRVMSHHRTFEWLKNHSHASVLNSS